MESSEHDGDTATSATLALADAFLASRRLYELPEEVFQLGAVWSACERCAAGPDAAAAARLYGLLAGFAGGRAERCDGAFWWGTAAHYLGVLASALARWDAAALHFEEALHAGARAGAALEVRRTQLAYVRLLLARGAPGDDAKAERLLAEVIASLHLLRAGGSAAAAAAPPAAASHAAVGAAPPAAPGSEQPGRYLFRREGDYWALAAGGKVSRLRSLRGFEYIAELLRHPYTPIYVVDLAALGVAADSRLSAEEAVEHGLRVSAEADVTPALDRRAREDYRARWRELLAEEAEARRHNDPGRVARAQREIDMLAAQLTAVAIGGSGRSGASLKERARVNVRNCITGALRALRAHDEPLWRHLSNSIKTGSFCCYGPDRPVLWEM